MVCTKCKNELPYGARYCNKCGENIPHETYEPQYNNTVWAKFDKAQDVYNSLFLKKITDSLVFKIISLVLVLGYFFFTMYGNLTGIRLKENDAYTIEYNTKKDEYYIILEEDAGKLDMFVPFGTDKIVFEANKSDKDVNTTEFTVKEYKNKGYEIKEDSCQYINIKAIRKGKKADSVKVVVVSK